MAKVKSIAGWIALILVISPPAWAATATITCDAPTGRVNGDALLPSEIKGYDFLLVNPDGTQGIVRSNECRFTTPDLSPGVYEISIQVVDNWGLESGFTTPLTTDIIPSSPPNKASNVRIRIEVMDNGNIIISVPE